MRSSTPYTLHTHSTPCFEFWLLLHIQGYTTRADLLNGTLAKEAVEKELGQKYSTNADTAKLVIPTFLDKWPEAFKYRAEEHAAPIAKPPYPLPVHLEELISVLERVRPRNFSTAALQILAYGTNGLEKLDEQIPGCEDAWAREKARIAGISNNQHADAALVLFGAVRLDFPV